MDKQSHLHVLGFIYFILGWLNIAWIPVFIFMTIRDLRAADGAAGFVHSTPAPVMYLVSFSLIMLVVGWLGIWFGRSLQMHRLWATRVVGFIVAFAMLFSFPIGTAVGIYTFWVLIQLKRSEGR